MTWMMMMMTTSDRLEHMWEGLLELVVEMSFCCVFSSTADPHSLDAQSHEQPTVAAVLRSFQQQPLPQRPLPQQHFVQQPSVDPASTRESPPR